MANNNILADSIRNVEHLKVFDDLAAHRMGMIDMTPVLINLIDTVPAAALPYLADQFDVLGYKGLKFADTEQKKRDLIKTAVELHRFKGTPWAVKESLKVLGIMDAEIIEGILYFTYNGEYYYDGFLTYGEASWATFRVVLDASTLPAITASLVNDVRILINEYKNVRSHLLDVSFKVNLSDNVLVSDTLTTNDYGIIDTIGPAMYYDGSYAYNGAITHDGEQDDLTINIINVTAPPVL